MKINELEKLELPPEKVESIPAGPSYDPVREEWVGTGESIEDSREKTVKDYRDDIIEAAVNISPSISCHSTIRNAVDAYHAALRKADREGK